MATKTISVEMLAKMFLAGAQNIESKKEFINELNVFPVPDGDTGTNMSLTIMSAAKEVTALKDYTMKDLYGGEQKCDRMLVPMATIKRGKVAFQQIFM